MTPEEKANEARKNHILSMHPDATEGVLKTLYSPLYEKAYLEGWQESQRTLLGEMREYASAFVINTDVFGNPVENRIEGVAHAMLKWIEARLGK